MAAAGVLNGALTAENQPRSTTTSSVPPRLTRAESNRRNSQRSTGPRTQAGKEKVRFNGLKHGMTARSTVLPGEDPARFEAACRQLHDDLAPRDPLEAILVDRIAVATWQANRDDQVARARREAELEHQALEQAGAQNRQVIALGQLLLEDLSQPMPSRPAARAGGAEHPAQLVALLESTIPGCDWLLGRLRQLDGYLATPTAWVKIHGFELARLMGFYVSDFATDYRAALVLLASEVVTGETLDLGWAPWLAAIDARVEALDQAATASGETVPDPEHDEEDDEEESDDVLGPRSTEGWHPSMCRRGPKWRFVKKLVDLLPVAPREIDSMHLDRLVPDNAQEARRRLALVIAEMIARLESIRANLMRVAQADAAAAAVGLMAESGKERELERRYSLSHGRLLLRTILELDKMRKSPSTDTLDHDEPNGGDPSICDWAIPPTQGALHFEFSPAPTACAHEAARDTSQQAPHGADTVDWKRGQGNTIDGAGLGHGVRSGFRFTQHSPGVKLVV